MLVQNCSLTQTSYALLVSESVEHLNIIFLKTGQERFQAIKLLNIFII